MNSCILDMKIPESKVTVVTQTSYQQQDSTIRPPTNDDGGSVTPYNTPIPSAYISPGVPRVYIPDSHRLEWDWKDHGSVLQGDKAPTKTIFPATNAEYPESSSHVFTLQGQQDNGALSMAPAESSLLSPEYGLEQTVPDYTN